MSRLGWPSGVKTDARATDKAIADMTDEELEAHRKEPQETVNRGSRERSFGREIRAGRRAR